MTTNELAKKSKLLRLNAQNLAEGMKLGNFRSLFRGQGIEFSGVRDYIRGDDIRAIDWNVTARMARPFVKVFEEERELQIFIILDASLSMKTEGNGKTKYQTAQEAASLITLASEINSSPVGLVKFDGRISFSCLPKTGREQIMLLLKKLETENTETEGSALGQALNTAGSMLKKRSLVFVLSDFRVDDTLYLNALGQLAHKNDVVAIRMTDSFDKMPPDYGTVTFVDVESGETKLIPTASSRFQKAWQKDREKKGNAWQDYCIKHGIKTVIMSNTDDPFHILAGLFTQNLTGSKGV